MKIPLSLCLLTVLGAAVMPGCRLKNALPGAGNADPIPAPAAPASNPDSPAPHMSKWPFKITTKSTTRPGAAPEFSLDIENISKETVDLNFSSGQKFDFSATRVGETEVVWSYGMNKRFIQSLSTVALEPGKPLHFETTWKDAKPGKYTIRAVIKANGGMESTPFEIEVN